MIDKCINEVYSKSTYWKLVLFHIFFPVALFGIPLFWSPFFIYIFYIPLGLIILSLLGIITASLQDKNVNAGYLILINLSVELCAWIWLLNIILDGFVKNGASQEGTAYIWVLILLLVSIFVHIFITCSLFASTSGRKLKLASLITFIFTALVGGGMVLNSLNSLRPSWWQTYKNYDLGYEIRYSPTLRSGGFDSTLTFAGNAVEGTDGLEITQHQSNSQSVEEWLKNEWINAAWTGFDFDPYTPVFGEEGEELFSQGQEGEWPKFFARKTKDLLNKAESMEINSYRAIKLPTVPDRLGQSYAVFISNGNNKIIKIICNYRDDNMKEICSKMISTFRFIGFIR